MHPLGFRCRNCQESSHLQIRKCIEEAFDNRENDTPEYSWKFTHEQVLETQEYVETYGISTSEHQDALWNYFDKYKASFKKLK